MMKKLADNIFYAGFIEEGLERIFNKAGYEVPKKLEKIEAFDIIFVNPIQYPAFRRLTDEHHCPVIFVVFLEWIGQIKIENAIDVTIEPFSEDVKSLIESINCPLYSFSFMDKLWEKEYGEKITFATTDHMKECSICANAHVTLEKGKKYIVNFSGGITSALALFKLLETIEKDDIEVVFADTGIEDPDLYRFMEDCERHTGMTFTKLKDERTPFTVMWDLKMFSSHRYTPCSKVLKRDRIKAYLIEKYGSLDNTIQVFGYTGDEKHRIERIRQVYKNVCIPLENTYFLQDCDKINAIKKYGIRQPLLYDLGFRHNNCGGFCVNAGHAHYEKLYHVLPDVYTHAMEFEQALREETGKNISYMSRSIHGKKQPYTLAEHKQRIENKELIRGGYGQCSCFLDMEEE